MSERTRSQRTYDEIGLAGLAISFPAGQVNRLPDNLLGLGIIPLEDKLNGRRNEHDTVHKAEYMLRGQSARSCECRPSPLTPLPPTPPRPFPVIQADAKQDIE